MTTENEVFMVHQERGFFRKFVRYVTLSMLSSAGVSLYILADTYFIARGMGTNGIAALNLLLPAFSLVNALGIMFGMGAATRYKIRIAEGRKQEANRVFTEAFLVAGVVSLLFVVLGLTIPEKISQLLGGDENTIPYMVSYLTVIWGFAPLFILNNLMVAIVRNDNRPGLAMGVMLVGSLLNVVLDWVFIFPLGLGMFGAALATGIAPLVSLVILFFARLLKKNTYCFVRPRIVLRELLDTIRFGISSFVNEMSNGVVVISFNFLLLGLAGNTGVAAYGIITNIAWVVIGMINGIAQGAQPLMSASHGAGDKKTYKKTYGAALVFGAVFSVSIYALLAGLAAPMISLFNSDGNLVLAQIAEQGIYLYFIGMLPAAFTIITAMYFNSTEKPMRAIVLSLLRGMVLLIPIALLLSTLFGVNGIWTAVPATEVMTCILAGFFLLSLGRKRKGLEPLTEAHPFERRYTVVAAGLDNLPDAKYIREEVFVKEQGATHEFDEVDDVATHALVRVGETSVATGRAFLEDSGWRIGRVAVLKAYRKQGFGREILAALECSVKEQGGVAVELFAERDAVGFYKKAGYLVCGKERKGEFRTTVSMVKKLK